MRKFTVLIASIGLAATSMTISPFAAASTSPGPTIAGIATRADGSVTAKTGWSSSASMSYTNNSSSNKRICGTHGYWGGTPIRAVTK